jgi:ligand-binding SRPBCC domain-containing protein
VRVGRPAEGGAPSTYERSVHIDADLDRVWAFHADISGLLALTPEWVNLRVEDVRGPDGEAEPDSLSAGTTISLSVRPFGVGPRQSFTSVIAERERSEDEAVFVDTMRDGPLPAWRHTHRFRRDDAGTLLTDHVAYRLPGGTVGTTLGPLAVVGFDPMFRYRHRETRRQLEGRW